MFLKYLGIGVTKMNNKSFSTKRIAQGYANRPWLHKNVILELQSDIGDMFKNGLDVGCGAGLSTKALHLICQKVTGTDISRDMIDVCKELYVDDNFSFYVAKAEETQMPKVRYDIVTAAGVINWVDRNAFLKNMNDVMTEDGILIIYDFWISNQMQNNPDYTKWYDKEYLVKFPKPARNEEIWKQDDMDASMCIRKQKEFNVKHPFSIDDFIEFMMIQSNVNEKIRKQEVNEREVREWMNNTLAPVFNGNTRMLVFHGYYWIIERIKSKKQYAEVSALYPDKPVISALKNME